MAKKAKKKQPATEAQAFPAPVQEDAEAGSPSVKMKMKDYEREMQRLHGELVAMQEWVKASGAKVCVVFEGRDTAGKGGTGRPAAPVHSDGVLSDSAQSFLSEAPLRPA